MFPIFASISPAQPVKGESRSSGWYILLEYHLVEQKQPMHKTSSNQSDSSRNQKIRLYDYDEARSELLIRVGKKVLAREKFIFCRIFIVDFWID